MASILSIRRIPASPNLRRASACRFCSTFLYEGFLSCLEQHAEALAPRVLSVASSYGSDVPQSCRGGNGIFLNPTLILTTAHTVGHVESSVDESRNREKGDLIEHGPILYKSYIGTTVALTADGETLETRPLAVNFVSDDALLEVVPKIIPQRTLFHPFGLAYSPPDKGNGLINIDHSEDFRRGKVRAVGEKTIKAKAPWPIDNELGWIEHEWADVDPHRLMNSGETVFGSVTRTTGSPWFNHYGEIAGMSSWEVRDESDRILLGFLVPPSSIRSVLEYAKTKRRPNCYGLLDQQSCYSWRLRCLVSDFCIV